MGVLEPAIYLRSDLMKNEEIRKKDRKGKLSKDMISNENKARLDPMGRSGAKITPGSGSHHEVPLLLVLCFSGDPFISPFNQSLPAGFEM